MQAGGRRRGGGAGRCAAARPDQPARRFTCGGRTLRRQRQPRSAAGVALELTSFRAQRGIAVVPTEGLSFGMTAIPRLRPFGPPLGMTQAIGESTENLGEPHRGVEARAYLRSMTLTRDRAPSVSRSADSAPAADTPAWRSVVIGASTAWPLVSVVYFHLLVIYADWPPAAAAGVAALSVGTATLLGVPVWWITGRLQWPRRWAILF